MTKKYICEYCYRVISRSHSTKKHSVCARCQRINKEVKKRINDLK